MAQSTAITQISSAVGSMDRATQQNAAMVEETSAAARNLANEVGTLAEKASHFKTDARRGDERPAVRKIDIASFNQPIRPLPAAAVMALTPNGATTTGRSSDRPAVRHADAGRAARADGGSIRSTEG